jgi:hypothetical protein
VIEKVGYLGRFKERPAVVGWRHSGECGCKMFEVVFLDDQEPGVVGQCCAEHLERMQALLSSINEYRPEGTRPLHEVVSERFETVIVGGEPAPTWRTHR